MLLLIYTATIFLSALLLFLVQPMVAKMVLPVLGGSPAVWNTSMVFFQGVLLAGYLYAHLLTRLASPARQVLIHSGVLLLPLAGLAALQHLIVADPRGFTPPRDGVHPTIWLLGALALAVGGPFFILSTTGPLMQRWFSSTTHRQAKDPYFLYAASNVGSMLALLGYPLVMESMLRLREQRAWFTAGFAAFASLAIGCGVLMLRSRPEPGAVTRQARRRLREAGADAAPEAPLAPLSNLTRLRWVLLAAVPSSLMLGVTQHVSCDIAAVPLLWVVPLALYLLTFILAFSGRNVRITRLSVLYFVVAGFLAISMLARMSHPVAVIILTHLMGLFLGALVCHGRLAAERPDPRRLTEYFLLIALGGVLGGSFNALVAPVVFNGIAEYAIAIAAACLLAAPSFGDPGSGREPRPLTPAGAAREIAYFLLVALAWEVVFELALNRAGTIFGFWLVFTAQTALLAAYCLWRAARNPLVLDLLAPLGTLAFFGALQYAFWHAAWVGGWYAAAAAGCALALLGARLAFPRSGRVTLAADLLIPAIIALNDFAVHVAVRESGMVGGSMRVVVALGLTGFLMLLSIGRRLRVALSVAVVMALYYNYAGAVDRVLHVSRTFFGVHRVSSDPKGNWHLLSHGTTRHGVQNTDPRFAMRPTMYYHPTGPIGQLFKSRWDDPTFDRIAIMGLGTGGLTSYGQKHQTFTYYEIDPEIVWIARDSGYFTFLGKTPAAVDIVMGDGRLMMSKAPPKTYDLIIMDAFSSDSIPMHLITREAAEMYFDKLAEGGLLVFHVSNRYMEFRPVLGAIAEELGVVAVYSDERPSDLTPEDADEGKVITTWVVLARRPEDLGSLADDKRWVFFGAKEGTPLWTDDYSNILHALIR